MPVEPPGKSFGQWKILVICPNPSLLGELSAVLTEYLPFSPALELTQYPTRAVLAEALQNQGANLCFVDVGTNAEWATALLSELSGLDARLPIVAIHDGNDPSYIMRTLRQGATEFLFRPVTGEHFVPVMERIVVSHRGPGFRSSKIYCVIPAKGACGASTLACNLAHYSKRALAGHVLLADLDPFTGTISFQLKLKQGYSFLDALKRGHQMDEDIWKGLVASSGGIDVLLAPEAPVHGIDEEYSPANILEFTRSMYDCVIVDGGCAYGQWSLTLAGICNELLLVTTNELPALQSTQRALAYLDRNRIDRSKVRVVVNRYHRDCGLSHDVIETALHTEVFHLIPSDYVGVQRALVDGKPIPAGSEVGKAIMSLAEKLAGKKRQPPQPKAASLSNLFGLLRR